VRPTKNTANLLFFSSSFEIRIHLTGCLKATVSNANDWGMMMTTNDMMAEIRDANLSYLMLAQQMIRSDKATAIFRLGISSEIADLMEGLNNAQILKLAGTNMMLARFRFDDGAILGMLTNYNKDRELAHSHAAILMAGQAVEELS
jgi:flagellar transcriptional activator FlhD